MRTFTHEELLKLVSDAQWVVTAFDQANTNAAVEGLGSRGRILASCVEDLRQTLKRLSEEESELSGVWAEGGP